MRTLRLLLVVVASVGCLSLPTIAGTQTEARAKISTKLKSIRLPRVQFRDATIWEAMEYFQIKARECDPTKTGVNIIAKIDPDVKPKPITIDLSNVPLEFALKTAAELAGMVVRLEPHAVLVTSITDNNGQMYTRVFNVPPNFLDAGATK